MWQSSKSRNISELHSTLPSLVFLSGSFVKKLSEATRTKKSAIRKITYAFNHDLLNDLVFTWWSENSHSVRPEEHNE